MKYQIIPVTPFRQNCTLFWCEDTLSAALVDPGGEASRIIECVEKQGVNVEQILLTHGHLDHVGAVSELATYYAIPIQGPHKEDLFWLEGLSQQSQMFGLTVSPNFQPTRWLQENDEISVGKERLSVLHCPGHTPGHIVFFSKSARLAFVGDVLFFGGVGRSDFPLGNHEKLVASIKEKLFPLGDDIVFIPGHGPSSTFGHERENNVFLK